MFTGIIEDVGRLQAVQPRGPGRALVLATALPVTEFREGDSLAVDGVCLTVTSLQPGQVTAFASHETLARTTLGSARAGRAVNLERALRLGDRLGGHFVSGHVDTTAPLVRAERVGEAWELAVRVPASLMPFIAPKGSLAVDGVSLTVNTVVGALVNVVVIPHTGRATTLLSRRVGETVNLETDVLAKYVAQQVGGVSGAEKDGAFAQALRASGFGLGGRTGA